MSKREYDNLLERRVSLVLGVAVAIWDAYAQAKGIPYEVRPWLYGILAYPYGENMYDWLKDGVKVLPDLMKKGKKILRLEKPQ